MPEQESFIDIIQSYLSSEVIQLPVFEQTGLLVQQETNKEEPDTKSIEKFIISDQALTSQVLKAANSAFYRGLVEVATVRDAIVRMGIAEVGNIVFLLTQKKHFRAQNPLLRKQMMTLWRHSVCCAIGSRWLARQSGFQNLLHESFVAGLLHDVGKLFLLTVIDEMRASENKDIQISDILLREVMDNLHTQQGYMLLKNWNLPDFYCMVARNHHDSEFDPKDALLSIVRLADQACKKLGLGSLEDPSIILAASPEAGALGLSEIKLAELEIELEDSLTLARI